jgi:hypothetical protein
MAPGKEKALAARQGHNQTLLALQLRFLFEMGAAGFGLVGAPPE